MFDIDTFSARLMGATEKEKADADKLEQEYGCKVYSFGQALLPGSARGYLRYHRDKPYVRWLSDLLVVRPDLHLANAPESMWFIDSKSGQLDTLFWDLERKALEAHRSQRNALGLPIVYIWPDGCSCSYVEDLTDERLIEGMWKGKGSKTPFWLFSKEYTRSLDDVFGKKLSDLVPWDGFSFYMPDF